MKPYALIIAVATLMAPHAFGETIALPGDADSLEEALDMAMPGDTVTLAEGRYYGPVELPDGVSIEGAGADLVSIRARGSSGPIIIAIDNQSGSISGVTIEHTSRDMVDFDRRYETPMIKIVDATITVRDCVITNSAGDGIHIEGLSEAHILNNECYNNFWDAIFVTGKGANPIVENNTCYDNGDDGIHVADGATGRYIANTCTANYTDGFSATGEETFPYIEGLQSKENTNGIALFPGASARVIDATIESNYAAGIMLYGLGGSVEVTDSVIKENEGSGLGVQPSGSATVSGTRFEANLYDAVWVEGFRSRVEVSDSEFIDSDESGIYGDGGAIVIANNNSFDGYSDAGITVVDPGTTLEAEGNAFDDEENGIDADYSYPTTELVLPAQLNYFFASSDFETLDAYFAWIHETGGYNMDGIPNVARLYGRLEEIMRPRRFENNHGLDFFERWAEASPDSSARRVSQAMLAYHSARRMSLSNSGNKKEINELLDEAEALAAEVIESSPNHLGAHYVDLAALITRDAPTESLREAFEEKMEIDPEFLPFVTVVAWRLSPYFDETGATLQEFLTETDSKFATKPNTIYARTAAAFLAFDTEDAFFDLEYDYDRAMLGFDELLLEFPDTEYYLNAMCYMAAIHEDKERAAPLFELIGDNYDPAFWTNEDRYYDWYDWAVEGHSRPGTPYDFFDEVGMSPSIAPLILLGFAGFFLLVFIGMCAGVVYLMRRTA